MKSVACIYILLRWVTIEPHLIAIAAASFFLEYNFTSFVHVQTETLGLFLLQKLHQIE